MRYRFNRQRWYSYALLLGTVVLISGCIGVGGPAGDSSATDSATTGIESTTSPADVRTLVPETVADTLVIGNNSTLPSDVRAHYYSIINFQNDTSLMLSLTVRRNGSTVLQHTETLPATSSLNIEVYRIGNYTVTIESEDAPNRTFEVPSTFDCNTHKFHIMYSQAGEWSTRTMQTLLDC